MTPLMLAALNGCRESVETLLLLGANPDILNSGGRPALFQAIQVGDQVITERLAMITTGGEARRRTRNNSSAVDCFQDYHNVWRFYLGEQ